jgi:hypothetical protein
VTRQLIFHPALISRQLTQVSIEFPLGLAVNADVLFFLLISQFVSSPLTRGTQRQRRLNLFHPPVVDNSLFLPGVQQKAPDLSNGSAVDEYNENWMD